MRRPASLVLVLALGIAVLGCDLATKSVAASALRGAPPVVVVAGMLDLAYTENRGAAFGIDRPLPARLRFPAVLLTRLVLVPLVLVFWATRRRAPLGEHAGYALLAGGAIGNLVDMLSRGFVVDFIHLSHWPVFNLADIAIVAGVALVALSRRGEAAAAPPTSPTGA